MTSTQETTWNMLNHAMEHYQNYISSKEQHYHLTIVDLLYISNFKGGNALITEPTTSLSGKLKYYENILVQINQGYRGKTLYYLTQAETAQLIDLCSQALALSNHEASKIRGFGASYTSALLAAYFINLIPILDRRILNGSGIEVEYDKNKQVKNIAQHYENLIKTCQQELKIRSRIALRQLDKEWFIREL